MKLGIISGPEKGRILDVPPPPFAVGDRAQVNDARVGYPEVIVERVEGPTYYHGSDRRDPWMFRVYEPARDVRYPASGSSLKRPGSIKTART